MFASDSTNAANPVGGTPSVTRDMRVFIEIFGNGLFQIGCYVLSPSDLTATGVQSATLHVALTAASTPCPGPVTETLSLPLTVDATWAGSGPISTVRETNLFSCSTYSTESNNLNVTNSANVTATLTPSFSGTLKTDQGSLVMGDQRVHAQGVDPQACIVRG
jgi:hypothetical protein